MLLIAFLLGVPLALALVGFAYFLWQDAKDRETRRYIRRTRFTPDLNGNYPAHFDPFRADSWRPAPGNPVNPPSVILAPGGQAPAGKHYYHERPLVVVDYSKKPGSPVEIDVQPEQIEQAEHPELPEPVLDERTLLLDAKRRGEGKIRAIEEICGVKRGGGKDWRYWSEVWEGL